MNNKTLARLNRLCSSFSVRSLRTASRLYSAWIAPNACHPALLTAGYFAMMSCIEQMSHTFLQAKHRRLDKGNANKEGRVPLCVDD